MIGFQSARQNYSQSRQAPFLGDFRRVIMSSSNLDTSVKSCGRTVTTSSLDLSSEDFEWSQNKATLSSLLAADLVPLLHWLLNM